MHNPQDLQPRFFPHMQGPPQGMHQGFEAGYPPPGAYGMPQGHLGFQPGMYPPPRGYPQQSQRGNMNQQRGYQGGHPGGGPSYRPNQPNPSKRPSGPAPQQNGGTTPQPSEKRGSRLSIVNPETNKEIEMPTQTGNSLSQSCCGNKAQPLAQCISDLL